MVSDSSNSAQPLSNTQYNMFGPYKLGKTLGQGEFGKVKFGIHTKTFQQVFLLLNKGCSEAGQERYYCSSK